jgi:hypothetical protein
VDVNDHVNVDVTVDVDGDGDGDVPIAPTQLRQHGDEPLQQRDPALVPFGLEDIERTQRIENRRALHGRTACDRVRTRGVGTPGAPCGFGDVERDGRRGAS